MATGWILAVSMTVCSSSGMVLCIGDDGHLAVEPVHEEHCHSTANEASPVLGDGHSTSFPDQPDDSHCIDVSIDLDKFSRVVKDLKVDRLSKDASSYDLGEVYLAASLLGGHRTQDLAYRGPPRPDEMLQVQRTIVLRL